MKVQNTGHDSRRADIVDSLYRSLYAKTEKFIQDKGEYLSKVASYMDDGLSEEECAELLIIEDGLSREAAKSYVENVHDLDGGDILNEYSFQFEDMHGKVWSSLDVGQTISACDETQAWQKAEEILDSESNFVEAERIISMTKLS